MLVFPVVALMFLVVALVAGSLLVAWQIVRRPILSIPIAVYIGLVVWLGADDAQALAVWALIVLAIWRLAHKRSFQRLVGRRLRRDLGAVGSEEALPAAPAHPEELMKTPELRRDTDSGKMVTTVSAASNADPLCVDLVLWDEQAALAVKHLVKGRAVTFSGRLEPRSWTERDGEQHIALEIHGMEIEYDAKPRGASDSEPVDA